MSADDPFDLSRFVEAQASVYAEVIRELTAGRKTSHWMWFIFPQAAGLGVSAMSVRYAIGSPEEAAAYLAHPILGPRYRECVALVEAALRRGVTLSDIFGDLDAMKYRSSRALFAEHFGSAGLDQDGRERR
jgi:uncharacterized protein (DUF1810 family)